jgi:hypothetical protein
MSPWIGGINQVTTGGGVPGTRCTTRLPEPLDGPESREDEVEAPADLGPFDLKGASLRREPAHCHGR